MGARGAGLPANARALILAAVLAALVCVAPAFLHPARTGWAALALLAGLYALAEAVPRCPPLSRRLPRTATAYEGETGAPAEVSGPLLLTAVLLLRPETAALVPVVGACTGRVPARHAGARRIWRAARLSLAAYVTAWVPHLLPGLPAPGEPLAAAGLPGALPAAALAVPVYCLALAALDGAVLIAAERCGPRAAWCGRFAPMLPAHFVHASAALLMAVLWRSPYGPVAALSVLLPMGLCCWVFAEYQRERAAHQSTVRALVQAVDIKDSYTRGHSERVGRASALIARELGMDDERTETLRFAGILHDVGKLGVPTRLLRKAGPLSPLERSVLELHPEYGHEMVRGIRFLGEARSAILHHHERLDGKGYPYGLRGTQIPEPARLVAVADAFDAMTSNRSYRRARPVHEAVDELNRCAGTHFDPRMVDALTRALAHHGWSPAVTADPSGDGARADSPADPEPAAAARRHTHRGVPTTRSGTRRTEGSGRHRAGAAEPGGAPPGGRA